MISLLILVQHACQLLTHGIQYAQHTAVLHAGGTDHADRSVCIITQAIACGYQRAVSELWDSGFRADAYGKRHFAVVFQKLDKFFLLFQHTQEALGLFHIVVFRKVENIAGATQRKTGLGAVLFHAGQEPGYGLRHLWAILMKPVQYIQCFRNRSSRKTFRQCTADCVQSIGIQVSACGDHRITDDTAVGNHHQQCTL